MPADPRLECARALSDHPLFPLLVRAALRARVSRMQPGEVFQFEGEEIFVEEDERSRSVVVQVVLAEERLIEMLRSAAETAGIPNARPALGDVLDLAREELRRRYGIELTVRRGGARAEAVAYKIERWSWRDGPL
ncbi:MAG: hypothetical protein N3G75_00135 [Methanothrix sp.]|nr:hypothetical protein [Methanothrix sp.]MCX8206228.1 hypothetical protein [Methanothrix sp.]